VWQGGDVHPVLILSALPEEIGALRDAMLGSEPVTVAGHEFWSGTVDGSLVVAATVGIGKVSATIATTLAISRWAPRAILFAGVGGSLDEAVRIGDVVVAERVVAHDTGTLGPNGLERYQPGHVPFLNPTARFGYTPPDALLERARDALADIDLAPVLGRTPGLLFGIVASGDQFVNDERVRRRLHEDLGALVAEMEGAAVAQTAERFDVPCIVVRAVSDLAGSGAPIDFARFVEGVVPNTVSVLRALLALL